MPGWRRRATTSFEVVDKDKMVSLGTSAGAADFLRRSRINALFSSSRLRMKSGDAIFNAFRFLGSSSIPRTSSSAASPESVESTRGLSMALHRSSTCPAVSGLSRWGGTRSLIDRPRLRASRGALCRARPCRWCHDKAIRNDALDAICKVQNHVVRGGQR
jgi:hypothetical protein